MSSLTWWSVLALIVCALLTPFWYWNGGLIETEALAFVRQYHDDRGVLRLVFDPHRNDLGTYQARELSYFFDYIDARVFGALVSRGYPLFVPLSAILSSVLTMTLFLRGARGYRHVPALTVLLLLLLYVTNYTHLVTMGMLYRSAKPLLPPLVVGTAFLLLSHLRGPIPPDSRRATWAPWLVFALFCTMSWLDRQGFFLALVGFGALALQAVISKGRRDLAVAAAGAVGVMVFYDVVAAPALIQHLHGYRPSFDYQRLPLGALADASTWRHAAALVLQAGGLLAGGVSPRMFAIMLALLALVALWTSWRPRFRDVPWLFVAAAQFVLFAMMIARHPPVYDYADHRVWYYPIALQALFLIGAVVFLERVFSKAPAARTSVVNLMLALAIVANVASWNDYLRLQLRSRWFPVVYEQNLALKSSLSEGRMRWYLGSAHQDFYRFCRLLQGAAP